MPNIKQRYYNTAREDLAKLIAQETCGLMNADPEQVDYDLADVFIDIINGERRHEVSSTEFRELSRELVDPKTY